jgi:type VI secretion system protein ImpJ
MHILNGFLRELHGLFNTRGEMLARELLKPTAGGVAEVSDFLLLQMINRYQPLFRHLSSLEGLHPEDFYRIAIQAAGELATFFQEQKRAGVFPIYDHDDLQGTFFPLMDELRDLLAKERMRRALQIPLTNPRPGVYGARLPDINLLDSAIFILAANAQVSSEMLRSNLPPQITIGPMEEIQQLVRSQLRGIPIEPLPVAPTEIPYHVGFTYFELNRRSEYWERMKTSGGFVFWIGGSFPGLKLEFWAIREA